MKIFIKDSDDTFAATPLLGLTRRHDIIFHLEKDKWTFVNSPKEADIIPLMAAPFSDDRFVDEITVNDQFKYIGPISNNQYIVLLFYTHAVDTFNSDTKTLYLLERYSRFTNNLLTVDINFLNTNNDPRHINTWFSFNYIKALFTEYQNFDFGPGRLWTGFTTNESFVLGEIKKFQPIKRFLIPNFIRDSSEYKEVVRRTIRDLIINPIDCFYSDNTKDLYLDPLETSDYFLAHYNPNPGIAVPIKESYYRESMVSVYGETICTGKFGVNVITEKTLVPLVRGHFILPFGYQGMVADLLRFGFKLPDWIDYSYDSIENDNDRLHSYIKSVNKLRTHTINELAELANQDLDLLRYNRSLFFSKPYDSLYDKIYQKIGDLK